MTKFIVEIIYFYMDKCVYCSDFDKIWNELCTKLGNIIPTTKYNANEMEEDNPKKIIKEYGNNIKNSPQAWSGFILLRKSFNPIRFIGEWLTYNQDYRISTDNPSTIVPNDHLFVENRHDQTILSLLCKKWGVQMHIIDRNDMIDIRNSL